MEKLSSKRLNILDTNERPKPRKYENIVNNGLLT